MCFEKKNSNVFMESSQRHGVFPLPGSVSLTRVEMCCCCFDILVQRPTCSNNARNKVVSLATLGYNLDPSCENTEHLRSWSGRCGGKGREGQASKLGVADRAKVSCDHVGARSRRGAPPLLCPCTARVHAGHACLCWELNVCVCFLFLL